MRSKHLVWIVAALAGAACGGTSDGTRRLARRNVTRMQSSTGADDRGRCDATRPGRSATEYDTNNDGVPDVRKVYQTMGEGPEVHSVLVCREVDLNHDGTKDVFRFYNDEGRTLREEADRDFDGRIDVITYFENGEVVRREYDTNRDGMVDMRTFYRDHRPFRAERELTHDASPDFHPNYWEFYDPRGRIVRIGTDYDHDGRADRWDRVDRVTPPRVAPSLSGGGEGGAQTPAPPPQPGTTPGATAPPAQPAQPGTTTAPAQPAAPGTTPPAGATPPATP